MKDKILIYTSIILTLVIISFWYNYIEPDFKLNEKNYKTFETELLSRINSLNNKKAELNNALKENKSLNLFNKKGVKSNEDIGICLNQIIEQFKKNEIKISEMNQFENKISIKFNSNYRSIYQTIYHLNKIDYFLKIEELNIKRITNNSNSIEGRILISFFKI